MRQAPGFTAEASLYRSQRHYRARGPAPVEAAVVPAQDRSFDFRRGHWFGVVNDCPRGQRLVYAPDKWAPKYCTVKRLEYNYDLMMWEWVESEYQCGWVHIPARWECQPPSLRAIP
jgi:hypothetical protein